MNTLHRALSGCIIGTFLLAGCGGSSGPTATGVGGSYLFVSVPDFYFGTKDVGTAATQEIEIANRGGNAYPIRTITLKGDNADEFTTDFHDELVLNPTEVIKVRVTFQPISKGRKYASLDVDFDTVKLVSEAANINEQNFYEAAEQERTGQFRKSLESYKTYIDGRPVTDNARLAAIKAPVLKEGQLYGEGPEFNMYLEAVNARELGEYDRALAEIDAIALLHSDSYLADDALYLRGYIQLMDQNDYAAAKLSMQDLRKLYPESNYYDSALYSEGLAEQSLGNRQLARSVFDDLRYRHTGVDALGIVLAKDNIISRMWFKRASEALVSLDG